MVNKKSLIVDKAFFLNIGKTKNRSNIDIYEDSEPYVKLGFTRQF
ncbi:hypothetical protein SPONN_2666 [uncultured Candidatus Thioglobus sp.]|nr:hypothetical protein SPONN_2666 [uncultured Candidatus Thioglobus sp.]